MTLALKGSVYVYRFLNKGAVSAQKSAIRGSKRTLVGFAEKMSDFEARHILGVTNQSTPEEIKLAHVRLTKIHHPDKGRQVITPGGSVYMSRKINEAKSQLMR